MIKYWNYEQKKWKKYEEVVESGWKKFSESELYIRNDKIKKVKKQMKRNNFFMIKRMKIYFLYGLKK